MFPATVEEVVAANLYSNGSLFKRLKAEDYIKIQRALEIVGMVNFKKKEDRKSFWWRKTKGIYC